MIMPADLPTLQRSPMPRQRLSSTRRYGTSQTRSRSLRLDACELYDFGPFVDVLGDKLRELVGRVWWHRNGAEIGDPLPDVRVKHRCVGLLVERRDDLRRCTPRHAETDPAGRLVALEEA